jgi:tetratricopeptide (TPR) repeat protein
MLEQTLIIKPDYEEVKKYVEEIRGELDKSETSEKSELKTDPLKLERAKRHYQTGLVYEGMGGIERAVEEWRKVLKIISDPRQNYYKKAKQKLEFYEK